MMMAKSKYFINWETKHRECGVCHLIMPFSKFGKEPNGKPIAKCKKCRSMEIMQRTLEKEIDKYPDDYLQCPNGNCNKIWKIRIYNRLTEKECPSCK